MSIRKLACFLDDSVRHSRPKGRDAMTEGQRREAERVFRDIRIVLEEKGVFLCGYEKQGVPVIATALAEKDREIERKHGQVKRALSLMVDVRVKQQQDAADRDRWKAQAEEREAIIASVRQHACCCLVCFDKLSR